MVDTVRGETGSVAKSGSSDETCARRHPQLLLAVPDHHKDGWCLRLVFPSVQVDGKVAIRSHTRGKLPTALLYVQIVACGVGMSENEKVARGLIMAHLI